MGGILQHNIAQLRSCPGSIDFPPEPMAVEKGQQAGMVDMGMGHKHIVDIGSINRDFLVFVQVRPLFHAAVYQQVDITHLDIMAASCHFVGSA